MRICGWIRTMKYLTFFSPPESPKWSGRTWGDMTDMEAEAWVTWREEDTVERRPV